MNGNEAPSRHKLII